MSVEPLVTSGQQTLNRFLRAAVERHGSDSQAAVADVRAQIDRLPAEERASVEAVFRLMSSQLGLCQDESASR